MLYSSDLITESKAQSTTKNVHADTVEKSSFHHQDNRPKTIIQQKQAYLIDNRPQKVIQQKQMEALATHSAPKKTNNTGLPDKLKAGIEGLSGHSMDDVKVHYNSAQPAQLNAHAYAQGTDIHIAPGQEKHLPHEAWHIVQQKQGRVKPTLQMKGKVNVNDDDGLEKEADVMGRKALQMKTDGHQSVLKNSVANNDITQKMSFFHGTTMENAAKIVSKIEPNQGKGEFGQGFYTVFSLSQAKHIAQHYWNQEAKRQENSKGIAVVKIDFADEYWESIMKGEGAELWRKEDKGFITDRSEEQANKEKQKPEKNISISKLPQKIVNSVEYRQADEHNKDLEKEVIIGPIKDAQTPYLQVVFGVKSISYLNSKSQRSDVWQLPKENMEGTSELRNEGKEHLGALGASEYMRVEEFKSKFNLEASGAEKQALLMKCFGASFTDNIPEEVVHYLIEKGVHGKEKGEIVFNFCKYGINKPEESASSSSAKKELTDEQKAQIKEFLDGKKVKVLALGKLKVFFSTGNNIITKDEQLKEHLIAAGYNK